MAAKKDAEATTAAEASTEPDITKSTLKTVASELDIAGRSSMDAPALAQAIVETVQPVAEYQMPANMMPGVAAPAAEALPEQPAAGQLPPR